MRRVLTKVVMATTVALFIGGCGDSVEEPPVSLPGPTNNHGTETAVNGLELEADDVYFGPTFIRGTADQQFSVELKNEGGARHSFTSTVLGVDLELEPGATRTFSLKAPSSGTAPFYCRFHQIQGMQGAVFVR